ncbi:MAG TPA: hypothetical protein VFY12_05910 [Arenimonas sp.]|nr:hypothetical protein [Arenimonas sp.]
MKPGNYSARSRADAIAEYQAVAAGNGPPRSSWKRQLAAAKSAWSRLSVLDLLRSGGREAALVDLVVEGYAVSRDEAGRRVRRFMHRPLE